MGKKESYSMDTELTEFGLEERWERQVLTKNFYSIWVVETRREYEMSRCARKRDAEVLLAFLMGNVGKCLELRDGFGNVDTRIGERTTT
jgi:hypothetical protein